MKIVLDTNIILDIVEKREPYFSASYQVFMKSAAREYEAIIGANSITDIYYITRKNCKDSKQALSFIIDILKVVTSVDTKAVDIQQAIRLNFSDFEDAVIAATASREGASYIITRNQRTQAPKKFLTQRRRGRRDLNRIYRPFTILNIPSFINSAPKFRM